MNSDGDNSVSLDFTVHRAVGRVNLATGQTPDTFDPINVAVPDALIEELESTVTRLNSDIVRSGKYIDECSKYVSIRHWVGHKLDYIYRSDLKLHVLIFTLNNGMQYTLDNDDVSISLDDFDVTTGPVESLVDFASTITSRN